MAGSESSGNNRSNWKCVLFCSLALFAGAIGGSVGTYLHWNARYFELLAHQLGSRANSVRLVAEGDCPSIVGRFFEDTPKTVQAISGHVKPGPLRSATMRQVAGAYSAHGLEVPHEVQKAIAQSGPE